MDIDKELVLLFEIRFKNELKNVALKIAELMGKNVDFKTKIWNDECQVALLQAARYFCYYYAVKNFFELLGGRELALTTLNLKKLSPEL